MMIAPGFTRVVVIAALASLCLHPTTTAASPTNDVPKQELSLASLEDNMTLKFEEFKRIFNKHYSSIADETRRRTLFISNAIAAFVSQTRYKNNKAPSYEKISETSDWTVEEFAATKMDADHHIQLMSGEINELQIEHSPVGGAATETLGKQEASWLAKALIVVGKRMKGAYSNALASMLEFVKMPKAEYRPDLPDVVFVDHRKGGCFNEVRKQGTCGSCYIFSTIALYEWAYCKAHGNNIKFSEQYPLDCGSVDGCRDGGWEYEVAKFIKSHGFQLLDDYHYAGEQKRCPYKKFKAIKPLLTGTIRMDASDMSAILPVRMNETLMYTPLIINMYFPKQMHQYGGGIYLGEGCGSPDSLKRIHSVVLVGSGRQAGHEYWIIRNSYGSSWGESGHIRLRKNSGCVDEYWTALKLRAIQPGFSKSTSPFHYYVNHRYDASLFDGDNKPREKKEREETLVK